MEHRNGISIAVSVLWPLVIYFLIGDLCQFFVGSSGTGMVKIGLNAILMTPILLVMYRKDGLYKQNIDKPVLKLTDVVVLILFSICTALGLNQMIVLLKIKMLSSSYYETSEILAQGSLLVRICVAGILVPIAEELIFRGLILNRLKCGMKTWNAILLSALLFGIYHMNLVQFIYAAIVGVLLACVYEKYQRLLVPILFHAVANIFVLVAGEISILGREPYITISCIAGLLAMVYFFKVGKYQTIH